MTEQFAVTGERRGRRRRFDEATERTMIMDAAIDLMASRGFADLAVTDILDQSGLSTRSFYRHFESREALVVALVRREAEAVARSAQRAIARVSEPVAAIEAWLERLLDTFFDPRQAARSAMFTTPAALAVPPLSQQVAEIRWLLARPLSNVLRAGRDAQVLVSPDPDADAVSIFALLGTLAHTPPTDTMDRAALKRQVQRFAWPALGLAVVS